MIWKIIGIILLIVLLIENMIVGYIFYLGFQGLKNEENCAYDVCENQSVYKYDSTTSICRCIDDKQDIVKTFDMREYGKE